MCYFKRLSFIAVFLLTPSLVAKPVQKSSSESVSSLSSQALDQALREVSHQLKDAQITWIVQDLKNGEIYSSEAPDVLMHPASTNKLATTAVALDTLGPHFTYRTRLWSSPPLPQKKHRETHETAGNEAGGTQVLDVLQKKIPTITLYWEASGDSKITNEVYQKWVKEIKRAGVDQINALIIDDHLFTDQALAPGYEMAPDDDAAYRAAAGAIGYDFNRLVIRVKPGKVGQPPRVSLVPPIKSARIKNTANTIETGKEELKIKLFERQDQHVLIEVTGQIPRLYKKKNFKGISVARRAPFPLQFAGEALLHQLHKAGIKIAPKAKIKRGVLPSLEQRSLVLEHQSPKLKSLLHDINTYSNNFMAEQTLLTLGLHQAGFGGWKEGISFVQKTLESRFKMSNFRYVNGSGLFGNAAFSARQLTRLLQKAHTLSKGAFAETLPKSRQEGTIKKRFKVLPKGAVQAKTGTLDGVSTLCGYLKTRARQQLTFCVMMSGFAKEMLNEARNIQDEMVSAMWRLDPKPQTSTPSRRRIKTKKHRKSSPKSPKKHGL